jgi:hypothetical protein
MTVAVFGAECLIGNCYKDSKARRLQVNCLHFVTVHQEAERVLISLTGESVYTIDARFTAKNISLLVFVRR